MDSLRWTACHGQLTTVAILNPASTPLGVAFLRANLQSRGNLCGVALTRAMGTFDRPVEALKTSQNTTS